MSTEITRAKINKAVHTQDTEKSVFGFWVYIMTDCVLFASLFATYAVLRNNTADGRSGSELFSMPFILAETLILLLSSFTCGLAILATHKKDKAKVLLWLGVTFALGLAFLFMEVSEFATLINEGSSWQRSGFLSAYFTLVGTHGLHILTGLLWLVVVITQIFRLGLASLVVKRLILFSLFWHFLDIVWIFIFTIVYLLGATPL